MLATAPLAAASGTATIEEIEDTSIFDSLQGEWNELLSASAANCLFLRWEWLFTWWKYLADGKRLSILAIRSADGLIGLAPLVRSSRSLLTGRALPCLEFLGSGQVGSDYLDLIVRPGCESTVRHAIASHLANKNLLIKWTQLKRDTSFAADVSSVLCHAGWTAVEAQTNVCPHIVFAGESWETYLAGLGAEHRYNFHRRLKRLNRDYSVNFLRVDSQDQCLESINLVIAQHNRCWQDRGGSDAFHTPGLVAFHQEFSQLALRRGWLRLYLLLLNDRPAATIYGFVYDKTFYFYQSSFDRSFEKQSVGLVTMGLAIQSAIEEGVGEFDFLHGNEGYKSHWSRQSRELSRIELYPPGSVGWSCRAAIDLVRSSRQLYRRIHTAGSAA